MANGTGLRRKVEDAERAAGNVITDQRRRVEGAVPVRLPTERQRLEASTGAAMDSTASLDGQAGRVRQFLLGGRRSRQPPSVEERYREAGRGVERPGHVFTTLEEAREHSEQFIQDGLAGVPGLSASPERPGAYEYRDSHQGEVDGICSEVSQEWMSREYLGDAVYSRFSGAPPVATLETAGWFATAAAVSGRRMGGMYEHGTNHVFVSLSSGENAYCMMAHEILHYAAYLGGGGAVRWRDGDGNPHYREEGWAVHEGMTELLAQGLSRSHGHAPSSVAYPYEAAACFAMQQIAGEEPLRRAYLSGDFTQVRTLVDARLGDGAFDGLMVCRSSPDAFSYLMERASAAGIDYAAWESDPIMAQCYTQIAVERFR